VDCVVEAAAYAWLMHGDYILRLASGTMNFIRSEKAPETGCFVGQQMQGAPCCKRICKRSTAVSDSGGAYAERRPGEARQRLQRFARRGARSTDSRGQDATVVLASESRPEMMEALKEFFGGEQG
jgi:hypothetical protein